MKKSYVFKYYIGDNMRTYVRCNDVESFEAAEALASNFGDFLVYDRFSIEISYEDRKEDN